MSSVPALGRCKHWSDSDAPMQYRFGFGVRAPPLPFLSRLWGACLSSTLPLCFSLSLSRSLFRFRPRALSLSRFLSIFLALSFSRSPPY